MDLGQFTVGWSHPSAKVDMLTVQASRSGSVLEVVIESASLSAVF